MVKEKLKIAFLSISHQAVERGAETFVSEVSKRLKVRGHDVDILSARKAHLPRWPILWRFFLDPQGVQVCLFTLKNLTKIWKKKYDVVIPVDSGWQPAWVRLTTWLYGGKMVISGQSGKGWDDRNNLWSFPNAFVAISSHLADWAKKANPLVKIEYVPNGVDTKKFNPKGVVFKPKLQRQIVLCIAALEKDKRIDLAIKAVSKIDASLLVVGGGTQRKELQSLGNELLRDRFRITKMPFEKIPQVYRSADIFTYPTVSWESFGIVMLEAMASGLPVVANKDPIRAEIVGDTGLLVDPTDTKAYAVALRAALKKDWGDSPHKQAKKFSWDKITQRYEKLFIDLVK